MKQNWSFPAVVVGALLSIGIACIPGSPSILFVASVAGSMVVAVALRDDIPSSQCYILLALKKEGFDFKKEKKLLGVSDTPCYLDQKRNYSHSLSRRGRGSSNLDQNKSTKPAIAGKEILSF